MNGFLTDLTDGQTDRLTDALTEWLLVGCLQAHKFQQDTSWHTGESQHGASNLPTYLSQQQLEQLQANGPAAAAGMTLSSSTYSHAGLGSSSGGGGSMYGRSGGGAAAPSGTSPFEAYGVPPGIVTVSSTDGGTGGGTAGSTVAGAAPGQPSDREQMLLMMGSGTLNNNAAAAAAAAAGGSEGRVRRGACVGADAGGTGSADPNNVLHTSLPSQRLPTEAYNTVSGGASSTVALRMSSQSMTGSQSVTFSAGMLSRTGTGNAGPSRAAGPASPAPGALLRSASAEFENPDGSGVYVAADDRSVAGKVTAPGRVVLHPAVQAPPAHFGSAPAVAPMGRQAGRAPGSLTAAATAADHEEEEGLRRMGVRSALSDHQTHAGSDI